MSFEPLYERLRELGGGPRAPGYATACAAIDTIRALHGALDDIVNKATFSSRDQLALHAEAGMRRAQQRADIQKEQAS